MSTTLPPVEPLLVLPILGGQQCPDFDEDCLTMSAERANWCFMGCQNHPCNPGNNSGIAQGYCPIIHTTN